MDPTSSGDCDLRLGIWSILSDLEVIIIYCEVLMKFLFALALYLLLPVPGILISVLTGSVVWQELDIYTGASFLGIAAFTWFAAQLVLSSKPFAVDKVLGTQAFYRLHGLGALLALSAAHGHWYLKAFVQGNEPSLQTLPGFLALNISLWITIVAILFMGNHFPAPAKALKGLRSWVQAKWGWTYKGLRAFHSLSLVILLLLGIHILTAGSVRYSWITSVYMGVLLALGVISYLRYRWRGRK